MTGDLAYSRWSPGEGITVHTILAGGAPWHVRVHRVVTDRALECEESGFAAGGPEATTGGFEAGPGFARVRTVAGVSEIHDLGGDRAGAAQPLPPNASLAHPFAAAPMLRTQLAPGRHELACAVFASDRQDGRVQAEPPSVPRAARELLDARCPLAP